MHNNRISLGKLWREVPAIARFIFFGLLAISLLAIWELAALLLKPAPLQMGEDFYLHVAIAILVPGTWLAFTLAVFGYAYYHICKRNHIEPFWEKW